MAIVLGLLGSLEVRAEGPIVALGSPAQRRLLAMLAVQAGEVVSAERLADVTWCGDPPVVASADLENHVYKLRNVIGGDRVITRPPGYLLGAAGDEIDAGVFEGLVRAAERSEPGETVDMIDDAPALWRGPPLAEFEYEDWARPTVVRREGLHLAAIERCRCRTEATR